MYIQRTVQQALKDLTKSFPCVVVYGPRQVGKSTTINFTFGGEYPQVTLDDVEDRALAQSNPRLFLETYQWPLIIDEIQKAPLLLEEIKKIIDSQRLLWLKEGKERQLMYILTGSNRFELQQGISDSLAGRCGIIEMDSFSQAERYQQEASVFSPSIQELLQKERKSSIPHRTKSQIFEDIFNGGMPDICTGVSQRESYFKSYVANYIEKDVRQLIETSNELQFRNFMSILALRTAQELHYDEIANSVGIDVRTCKRWLSILETSGIVYLLHPYMANVSNRIIKAPKLYFMDTGLCAYLCRWPSAKMLEDCAMNGAFFETYVVSELVKNFHGFNREAREYIFYYRDIDRKEIDILYVEQNKIFPIEIKLAVQPKNPTRHFKVLSKYSMEIQPGLIITPCDKIRPLSPEAYLLPVHLL